MRHDVAFQLLGPIQVRVGKRHVPLYGSRQERLLAALLLDVGRVMTMDRLIEIVWDERAPVTARRQIQDLAGRLRRDLVEAGLPGTTLTMARSGYLLDVPAEVVDVAVFQRGLADGRARRVADPPAAAAAFRAALGLWRGEPMAGLASRTFDSARAGLHESRLAGWEQCIEIELGLGCDEQLVSELSTLVDLHPYREHLVTLYMHALYRAGRTVEALRAFHVLRLRLAEELGIQPGPDVRQMHQLILRDDPRLMTMADIGKAVRASDGRGRAPGASRMLPRDIPEFVGRAAYLTQMDSIALGGAAAPGSAPVMAIVGPGGAGKTALAVHWGHTARDRFPDGQLFVDLRAQGVAGPRRPIDALRLLLGALGVADENVPATADQAAGLYRSMLTDRQVLIVLDNACSAEQVRPMLPPTAGCVVLVTSRGPLRDLVARDSARPIAVDALTEPEARALLIQFIGETRAAADPGAVQRLIRSCECVPLRLRMAAAMLIGEPTRPIADVIGCGGRDVPWDVGATVPATPRYFRA